ARSARVLPQVVLPHTAPAELPGGGARQRRAELDAARVLQLRQPGLAVGEQVGGQVVAGGGAVGGLHERDDDLPPVLVGDADDDDVADRRVLQQRVLDLGRVDVDAAGDDEVGAAVAHVEPAVLVEVPEVAGRVEVAAHGGRGLLRVPVVLETGLPARVDQAGLPRRQLRAVRVEDLDLDAVDRAPHGAGAGEPLLGGGDDDRSALGGAVV